MDAPLIIWLAAAIYFESFTSDNPNLSEPILMEEATSMKKLLIALGVAAMLSAPAFAEEIYIPNQWRNGGYARVVTTDSPDFYSFHNGRFGIRTYVPSCVTKAYLPANSDGAIFKNDDESVTFRVSGSYVGSYFTINDYFASAIGSFEDGTISFSSSGSNWYAVSGVKDGMVIYKKGLIIGNVHGEMEFDYPAWDKDSYDWMVPVLEENFFIDG